MESKFDHPEWPAFDGFFMRILVSSTESCFERDILRNCKDFMFSNWVREVEKYNTKVKDHDHE